MSLTTKDLRKVYSRTYEARNKWQNILLALGVSNDTIVSIGKENRDSPDNCYRIGLSEWLSSGSGSWKDIANALADPTVGYNDIASGIEKEYFHPTETTTASEIEIAENVPVPSVQKVNDKVVLFTDQNIGNGAYGAVYKGEFDGKPCALKMLHLFVTQMQSSLPVSQGIETARKALALECDRLQSFQHKNVVQHISTEKHSLSNNIILVIELMDCNLKTYLSGSEGQSLTASFEISLCKDIASGLAYIHSRHVIHRDLCDDNILLKLVQPVPVAKISDFGMSKLLDPSRLSASLSLTSLVNRIGYLPPEASQGEYDQSLDIFSFGVIMMQIVCKLSAVQTAKDRSLFVQQIPRENRLKGLIQKCLQENPAKRPSAESICDEVGKDGFLELNPDDTSTSVEMASPIIQEEKAVIARDGGMISLNCFAEYNHYALSNQTCWAVVSFSAPSCEYSMRTPVDIVAVIDKSGSMGGRKLELVKDTLKFMIDLLTSADCLSVVTYDSDVEVKFGLMQMAEANKTRAKSLVATIVQGSFTNLCGGLLKGLEVLTSSHSHQRNSVQSVLLFTDGMANAGITDTTKILAEVKSFQTGVEPEHSHLSKFAGTIYTFGFGSDHNSTLLEAIASHGKGIYCYIDTNMKIPEAFAGCLGGLLSVVGQNISLKLELQGGNSVSEVHDDRAINWTTPNMNCDIDMGDLQFEEERDVVLELKLPALSSPQQDLVLKASLSYFNVITSTSETDTVNLTIERKDGCSGYANEAVDLQRNRIVGARALKDAASLVNQNKHDEAKSLLLATTTSLEKSPSQEHELIQCLLRDLHEGVASIETKQSKHGLNFLQCKAQVHAAQRGSDLGSAYITSRQICSIQSLPVSLSGRRQLTNRRPIKSISKRNSSCSIQ